MDIGVFSPTGSNGWLISTTSPRYKPSGELNRDVVTPGTGIAAIGVANAANGHLAREAGSNG